MCVLFAENSLASGGFRSLDPPTRGFAPGPTDYVAELESVNILVQCQ